MINFKIQISPDGSTGLAKILQTTLPPFNTLNAYQFLDLYFGKEDPQAGTVVVQDFLFDPQAAGLTKEQLKLIVYANNGARTGPELGDTFVALFLITPAMSAKLRLLCTSVVNGVTVVSYPTNDTFAQLFRELFNF